MPIVGVGVSAGGLEAFTQLLSHLDRDTGLALVLVQHLDPKHESMLTELLSRATPMRVREVRNGMRIEPNHIYVIPPNSSMAVLHGRLNLVPRTQAHRQHLPIETVDVYRQNLKEKLKLPSATSLIQHAVRWVETQNRI